MRKRAVSINNSQTILTNYHAMYPCSQIAGSGDVVDVSGQNNNAALGSDLATAASEWDNAGSVTTILTANDDGGIEMPSFTYNMADGDSFILMAWLKMAEDGQDALMGNRDTTTAAGIRATMLTGGSAGKVSFGIANGSEQKSFNSGGIVADGTWHHMAFLVDGQTKKLNGYYDGALDLGWTDKDYDFTDPDASTNSADVFKFSTAPNEGAVKTFAAQWRGIHTLVYPASGLPSNATTLVASAYSSPYSPLRS